MPPRLKENIEEHGGEAKNESGCIAGWLHRTWLSIKGLLTGHDNSSLIDTIVTAEKAVLISNNHAICIKIILYLIIELFVKPYSPFMLFQHSTIICKSFGNSGS